MKGFWVIFTLILAVYHFLGEDYLKICWKKKWFPLEEYIDRDAREG